MILWIAMYTNVPINPKVPPDIGGWTRWRIWQYSESETVQGVEILLMQIGDLIILHY